MPLFVADEITVQRSVSYQIRSVLVVEKNEKFDVVLC
jgi:hypothetical protein